MLLVHVTLCMLLVHVACVYGVYVHVACASCLCMLFVYVACVYGVYVYVALCILFVYVVCVCCLCMLLVYVACVCFTHARARKDTQPHILTHTLVSLGSTPLATPVSVSE